MSVVSFCTAYAMEFHWSIFVLDEYKRRQEGGGAGVHFGYWGWAILVVLAER